MKLLQRQYGWLVPRENSRHCATPPLVYSPNDVWEKSAEIPFWWRVTSASDWKKILLQLIRSTTQIWVVTRHQFGISAPFLFDWIVLFRIWFKRFLSPAHVTYWSCLWPLELMTSQVVQRTRVRTGGSSVNGFFINCHCFHCNWKIWRDAFTVKQKSPYMSHLFPSCTVHGMQFCPFEDVLGVGHSQGFGSLLIPGNTCICIGVATVNKTITLHVHHAVVRSLLLLR